MDRCFCESAVKFLFFGLREDVIPNMSGIPPRLKGPAEKFRDVVIIEGLTNFITFLGIESPVSSVAPAKAP